MQKTFTMLVNKTLLTIIFLLSITELGISCSCDRIFFCEYIKRVERTTAIRAIPISAKSYAEDNDAVYLRVIEVLRDDFGITDTIKLYGMKSEAGCSVDVINHFPIGQEIYFAFGKENEPNNNPDSLQENYYENWLSLCKIIILKVFDGKVVTGPISQNAILEDYSSLYEYPLSYFRENLDNCSYNNIDLSRAECEDSEFLLYPNPYRGGEIKINTDFRTYRFDRIEVYSSHGQLITNTIDIPNYSKLLLGIPNNLPAGVYFLVIHCGERRIIRKLLIQ